MCCSWIISPSKLSVLPVDKFQCFLPLLYLKILFICLSNPAVSSIFCFAFLIMSWVSYQKPLSVQKMHCFYSVLTSFLLPHWAGRTAGQPSGGGALSCNLLKPQLFGGGGTWQEHGAAGGMLGLTSLLQAEWLILLRWESRTALSLLAPQIIGSEHHFTLILRGARLFPVVLPLVCALLLYHPRAGRGFSHLVLCLVGKGHAGVGIWMHLWTSIDGQREYRKMGSKRG